MRVTQEGGDIILSRAGVRDMGRCAVSADIFVGRCSFFVKYVKSKGNKSDKIFYFEVESR